MIIKNLAKLTLTSAAVLLLLPALPFCDEGKSIYGEDDRKDFFAMSSGMKDLAESVVSMWRSDSVIAEGSGFRLKTTPFSEKYFGAGDELCPDEPFADQPIGAFCSGTLVGEDLILTAGHCITSEDRCKDTRFVFGFAVTSRSGEATTAVPAENVYSCGSIVKRAVETGPHPSHPFAQVHGADYALIKLDRRVTGREPLPVNRGADLKRGDGIFVIGHPVGLPVKLAGGSSVRDFDRDGFFVADLDTFGGNSGSAVFNASTRKIEGILVRGDRDFDLSPAGCVTMATYAQAGGRGEDVTKIDVISSLIPLLPGEKAPELEVRGVNTGNIQPGEAAPFRNIIFD